MKGLISPFDFGAVSTGDLILVGPNKSLWVCVGCNDGYILIMKFKDRSYTKIYRRYRYKYCLLWMIQWNTR